MPTVGFLHTSPVHVPTFDGLVRDVDDRVSCLHTVHAGLLDEARRDSHSSDLKAATFACLEQLVTDGADVIVCTCSTLGTVAEALQAGLPVTVLRVDRPMARAAVHLGRRIAVVAALHSTVEPTGALLADEARRANLAPTIINVCVPDAWASFESQDIESYLQQIADAARSVAEEVDVVVLAQASMMGALDALTDLQTPVLASPPLAVKHALLEGSPPHTSIRRVARTSP